MSLLQRLDGVAQSVDEARGMAVGSATPQWRGLAAHRFDDRRTEVAELLVRVGVAVDAARAVTAEFERVWWEEAARQDPGTGWIGAGT
jgi:hypothetical protein